MVTKTQSILPFPKIHQSETKTSSQAWPKKGTVLHCTQFFMMLMTYVLKMYIKNALNQNLKYFPDWLLNKMFSCVTNKCCVQSVLNNA